jgi:branched-chain amino acid transport system substrate-binding protein
LAQDIKLGYNGDLSASPSAQSGQAAVIGMQAAIDDLNSAGGLLGRELLDDPKVRAAYLGVH